ncbi:hypothetical protein AB2475_20290, partial [Salmonella enterica]|nr:hypothetical protein [Salmonella enterica subsp. diarizonae]
FWHNVRAGIEVISLNLLAQSVDHKTLCLSFFLGIPQPFGASVAKAHSILPAPKARYIMQSSKSINLTDTHSKKT